MLTFFIFAGLLGGTSLWAKTAEGEGQRKRAKELGVKSLHNLDLAFTPEEEEALSKSPVGDFIVSAAKRGAYVRG